jgi:PEP-CTERM motif
MEVRMVVLWRTALVILAVSVCSRPAAAEPITAVYDVQIFERFSRTGPPPGVTEPFTQQFLLSMTFDPASSPGSGVYGRPVFSPVPLAIPSSPSGVTLTEFGSTTHIGFGGFFARAQSGVFGSFNDAGNPVVYDAVLTLTGSLLSSTPPVATTAETFPIHLTIGTSFTNFVYSSCLGVGPFGPSADSCTDAQGAATRIVRYSGRLTLLETTPAAIPEPATLALVASGLVILSRRRVTSQNRT